MQVVCRNAPNKQTGQVNLLNFFVNLVHVIKGAPNDRENHHEIWNENVFLTQIFSRDIEKSAKMTLKW